MTRNRAKKLPAILSIALPLIGFFLILGGLNLYQYYKIKNNIAAARLAKIGKIELVELQSFFDDMSSRLNIVREWGKMVFFSQATP